MAVLNLSDADDEALISLFASVFAGSPWFEQEKCVNCERAYPGPVADREPGSNYRSVGTRCWTCGNALRLMSFYMDPRDRLAERIIANARRQTGFIGKVAKHFDGTLIGFSWGYRAPTIDTPSVQFTKVWALLERAGIEPAKTFYAAETGVDPRHQRQGHGKELIRARLRAAQAEGYKTCLFRTIDRQRLVSIYNNLFGRVQDLFRDPDPAKSQHWFSVSFDDLRD